MPSTPSRISFFTDMIQQIADRGRALMGGIQPEPRSARDLKVLAEDLLSGRGEASGVATARDLLLAYANAAPAVRLEFLKVLARDFGADEAKLLPALGAYAADPTPRHALRLHQAAEPRRQELLRRLNRAPGGTLAIVRMREDLLPEIKKDEALADADLDFSHLLGSWFNRGFLVLKRIDWSSPAHVLEKIIRYEAVHAIGSFEDLRHRLAPPDRRLYAFFHPALADEPLIFVEVALTREIPSSIHTILAPDRQPIQETDATTAVFYSISNCQKGLAGVSFGNFLIKQVAEELSRDLPQLRTFVTLSPVPGFRAWLNRERQAAQSTFLSREERDLLAPLAQPAGSEEIDRLARRRDLVEALAATYLVRARNPEGRPMDPVARFHLGNGARLERIRSTADLSPKGLEQSLGVMVNYLYDLNTIERNHEALAERGEIVISSEVRRLARPALAVPAA